MEEKCENCQYWEFINNKDDIDVGKCNSQIAMAIISAGNELVTTSIFRCHEFKEKHE
jgi:hypothetical protein